MAVRSRLRLRLVGLVILASSLVAIAAIVGLAVVVGSQLQAAVDDGLRARAADVVAAVNSGDAGVPSDDPFAQVVDPDGHVIAGSASTPTSSVLTPAQLARAARTPITVETEVPALGGLARLRAEPAGRFVVVVGTGLTDFNSARNRLLVVIVSTLAFLVLLLAAGAWVVVGAALRPVAQMSRAASAMSGTNPLGRLPEPPGGDELALLARTLNQMLGRIGEFVERERAFLDDASHELRTPLTVLRGELELAAEEPDPERCREGVRVALREAERLSALAADLLVLARQRGGELDLQRETVDLGAWVADVTRRRASLGPDEVTVERADPVIADIDPARLERVLVNLLANASAVGATTVCVRVRREQLADGAAQAVIEVCDDGPGFDAELLPRAFERFARAGRTGGRPGAASSTGLGLAIVAALVDAHGGSVSADNDSPIGGARVTVRLPLGGRPTTG